MASDGCITPFYKQAFVATGASINMAQIGFVTGYVVCIVPQLRQPGSPIPMDDDSSSWFASMQGFSILLGNIIVGSIMGKYGRRIPSIVSATFAVLGWLCIAVANSLPWLFLGRVLLGFSLGFTVCVSPVVVGECSSPKNRGLLLSCLPATISFTTLVIHSLSTIHWRTSAIICVIISFINLIICIYSPESPSWLAEQGRYDHCTKAYRWLRGCNEEEELQKLIKVSKEIKECKIEHQSLISVIKSKLIKIIVMLGKKEAYKPIIIHIHVSIWAFWCGYCILASYSNDVIFEIAGKDVNVPLIIMALDILKFIINIISMYVVKKFKRKPMLLAAGSLNVFIFFFIALYTYTKSKGLLPFDTPIVGIILIHVHMLVIAAGGLPLPVIISGEIFPLEYRSTASGFSNTISSFNVFLTLKTFPYILNTCNIYGTYIIYGVVCLYSILVTYFLLPETKDRTLQDIEDDFRGRPLKVADESGELFLKDNV